MKTKSPSLFLIRSRALLALRIWLFALLAAIGFTAAQPVQAASQAWTNAPVDATWTNVLNWVAKAVPGDVNNAAANSVENDVATFTNALFGGIGGAANPIVPDDSTSGAAGARSRRLGSLIFDTVNCGAYVIASPTAPSIPGFGELHVSHLGSNYIGSTVVNPQVILIPMQVNLPSSTAGVYSMINNSATPAATLTISSITHMGATTRATTFILDGSNTGNNIVTNLSEGPGNATGGIIKEGTGTWIIAGPGTFPAASPMLITNGTLVVQDPGAFGVATTAVITNSILRIDGVSLTTPTLTLRNGGIIRMNGVAPIASVTMATLVGTSATLATTSATDVLTVGNGTAANGVTGGAVDSVLHVTGPGTVSISQSGNYVGKWSVDTGTNQISAEGALGTGANLNLNAGAVVDTTPFGASTYIVDTKAFSANGAGTAVGTTAATLMADVGGIIDFASKPLALTFTPTSFLGDSGHPALYCSRGTLAFHGNAITVNNASGTQLGIGTYQLVAQASGPISSSGAFVTIITGSGLGTGLIAEITAAGGNLNLVVTAYTPKTLVWTGNDPINPGVWDRQISTNWLSGATPVTFNIYDSVLFNSVGIAQPIVNLASTMVPGNVIVDTSAGNYTFAGVGQVAGGTALAKANTPGTLILQTANTYSGGTIISNGVVQLGVDEGISSTGPAGQNDVSLLSPAVFDLNGHINTVNGLSGAGVVDNTGVGTASTLNIGFNGDSGVFAGSLQNTAGTLGITKLGTGSETLTHSNYFYGTTDLEQGTLKVTDPNAIGGGASPVVINGGTLDMSTNLLIASLAGAGGAIANVNTTTTNILTIQGSNTTVNSFGGSIGGGKIALRLMGGTLRMTAGNTYSNGTFVAGGATFQIHNSPAGVTGPVVASNTATLGMSGGGSSPAATPTSITTVDGATVTFASAAEGGIWGGQFIGSVNTTNLFSTVQSIGGASSFSNFLGLVKIALPTGNFRFFNGGGVSGGDNTTFEFDAGNVHTRDAQLVSLGAVSGGSATAGIGGNGTAGTASTWIIGLKNTDSTFEGYLNSSNNLVKSGTGRLTLDGASVTTNTDGATFTNYIYLPVIAYLNATTVSNGVLALSAPNDLTQSSSITLASTNAILDTLNMGYVTNFNDINNNAASALVTNGTMTLLAATPITGGGGGNTPVLGGLGVVRGNGVFNYGTINPGLTTLGGTLTISNGVTDFAGATNEFELSDDVSGATATSDMLKVWGDVTLNGASTVVVNPIRGVVNPGTYPLIKYTGNLINEGGVVPSGPISNFTLTGQVSTTTRATLVLANAPGEVNLTVVSLNTKNLTWVGDGASNFWDIVTSANWNDGVGAAQFYQQDNVTFANGTTNPVVTLQGTVAPTTITITGGTNFVFGGSGSIIGDTVLTVSGTGSLTLTNGANAYSGGTIINSGILKAGAESAGNQNDLALGTGPVTVNAAGELRFGGNTGAVVNHLVTNSIIVNGGLVKAADGAQHLTNSTVTVNAAGATFQTVFATKNLVLDSPLIGTGNLTVTAGTNVAVGQVLLANISNSISGSVIITTNSNLGLVGQGGLSNTPSLDIQAGAILDISTRSNSAWSVVSGQTLKGNGAIRGRFVTASAGSTVAPGIAGAIGSLVVTNVGFTTNNFALVTLAGTLSIDINRGVTLNADRIVNVNGTNLMGGTLTVNNLGAALQVNDTFQLLVGATNTGAFAVTNLPALGSGLAWANTLSLNGRITVVNSAIIPTIPPGITSISLSGLNVVIGGTNGQPGGTYYLLMTTNLAKPLSLWKTIATNILSTANFTFIGTNAITPNAGQQFYSLSSTNAVP